MSAPRRILVVRTDRVGDVVLATPLIRALRRTFPRAYLAAMVRPYAREVLVGNPHLNEILEDDPDGAHAGRSKGADHAKDAGFWQQVEALRKRRFDTALLLLPTKRLAWMLWAAGIRRRVGVGTRLYQVLTGMESVSRNKYVPLRHEADYCMDLGRKIGVRAGTTDADLATEVFVTQEERRYAADRLHEGGVARGAASGAGPAGAALPLHFVCIHPGCGGSAPNWRAGKYVELAERLLEDDRVCVVVTGSTQEKDAAAEFHRLGTPWVRDFAGKLTLRELMGVLSRCSVVVSASTGPMHLAAALRVPTVSLFCPLTACSAKLWGPLGNRGEIVLPPPDYCEHRCPGDPKVCTFEGGIEVAEVAAKILRVLGLPAKANV